MTVNNTHNSSEMCQKVDDRTYESPELMLHDVLTYH